ncbi:MAG TPA: NUDIX domain-containing protein [Burkholderiales bacterium]|nr:NUDIX domain-containing protein [Burkholderiales bacterium]
MNNQDLTFKTPAGRFNYRVGAIIIRDGKVLMVQNQLSRCYYSVGGRIKYGESSEEAIIREVFEETGVYLEIDRLGFIHENFFVEQVTNETFHELSLYYYMKTPENFAPHCKSITENGIIESLSWLNINHLNDLEAYPAFFKDRLINQTSQITHITECRDI